MQATNMSLIAIHSDTLESIQTIMGGGGKGRKKERIIIGGSWNQRRRLEAGTERASLSPGWASRHRGPTTLDKQPTQTNQPEQQWR